jgi:RNA polymerase sigma-70 factor (ECF subfamily)
MILQLEASHGQGLFGFVRRLGLGDAEADDAVQEILLRLWTELERGATIEDPRAWAYRAIYRMAMDEHRLRRRVAALRGRLLGGSRTEPGNDESRAASDRIAVWAEVDHLPPRQREVLYLRYRSDLPFEDIGAVLGITSSAARSHATQALASLRRHIGSTWDD